MRMLNNLKYTAGRIQYFVYFEIIATQLACTKKTELTFHVCGYIIGYAYKSHVFHP
jgi:hypothetical protein